MLGPHPTFLHSWALLRQSEPKNPFSTNVTSDRLLLQLPGSCQPNASNCFFSPVSKTAPSHLPSSFPQGLGENHPPSCWLPFLVPGPSAGLTPRSYTGVLKSRRLTEAKSYQVSRKQGPRNHQKKGTLNPSLSHQENWSVHSQILSLMIWTKMRGPPWEGQKGEEGVWPRTTMWKSQSCISS